MCVLPTRHWNGRWNKYFNFIQWNVLYGRTITVQCCHCIYHLSYLSLYLSIWPSMAKTCQFVIKKNMSVFQHKQLGRSKRSYFFERLYHLQQCIFRFRLLSIYFSHNDPVSWSSFRKNCHRFYVFLVLKNKVQATYPVKFCSTKVEVCLSFRPWNSFFLNLRSCDWILANGNPCYFPQMNLPESQGLLV